MSKKGRVLVAMSGGIDSSVTAMLLHDEGYEVIGMTMKTWDYQSSGGSNKETGCCSLDSINDARNMAVEMGFPHYIIDIREEFGDSVIDYFTEEYMNGRTPNPCVMCNTHIKWDALLRRADNLGCDYIATGHYAQHREQNGRYFVSKGVDRKKDQSYVLFGISQKSLARTILPLGGMTKDEIRKIAMDSGFEALAKKPESYEICFIPDNDYRGFLERRVENMDEIVGEGEFVLQNGEVVGKHRGFPFYTIGQRKGLGIALGEAAYVTDIQKDTNRVVLGFENDLTKNAMTVNKLNMLKYAHLNGEMEATTKVRYHDQGTLSTIMQQDDNVFVKFNHGVESIAPGQAAVFYEGDDVIGGGWIVNSYNQ